MIMLLTASKMMVRTATKCAVVVRNLAGNVICMMQMGSKPDRNRPRCGNSKWQYSTEYGSTKRLLFSLPPPFCTPWLY